MPKFHGIVHEQNSTVGNSTNQVSNAFLRNHQQTIWTHGFFGISTVGIVTGAGTNFSVYVAGDLGGAIVPIAGISGINATISRVVPLVPYEATIWELNGTTQVSVLGIPTPRQIVCGSSAKTGASYQFTVYGALWAPD